MKGEIIMPKKMSQEEFQQRIKEYTNDSVIVISEYQNKRTKVKIKCKTCGYEWEISPCSIMPSNIKQHSFQGCPECKYEYLICSYCGKQIRRLKSEIISKSGFNYCSKECGNRHKSSLIKKADGVAYRRNAFEHYEHKCAICGYDDCIDVLEVHHIDSNRENNEIDNLVILCPTCHRKITLHYYKLIDRELLIPIE
jgi:5-methylcytosine-specific restriction endonuclease McrA